MAERAEREEKCEGRDDMEVVIVGERLTGWSVTSTAHLDGYSGR